MQLLHSTRLHYMLCWLQSVKSDFEKHTKRNTKEVWLSPINPQHHASGKPRIKANAPRYMFEQIGIKKTVLTQNKYTHVGCINIYSVDYDELCSFFFIVSTLYICSVAWPFSGFRFAGKELWIGFSICTLVMWELCICCSSIANNWSAPESQRRISCPATRGT